jgi:hypothetical protein
MWFLMGAVVVVVAIVGYLVMRDTGLVTSGSSQPAGGTVSINVDTTEAPAAAPPVEAPAEAAPAPAQAPEAAPAD